MIERQALEPLPYCRLSSKRRPHARERDSIHRNRASAAFALCRRLYCAGPQAANALPDRACSGWTLIESCTWFSPNYLWSCFFFFLSLAPGIPRITLSPDLVFLVVLPPLLYSAAWLTSWRDFLHNMVSISFLA